MPIRLGEATKRIAIDLVVAAVFGVLRKPSNQITRAITGFNSI